MTSDNPSPLAFLVFLIIGLAPVGLYAEVYLLPFDDVHYYMFFVGNMVGVVLQERSGV